MEYQKMILGYYPHPTDRYPSGWWLRSPGCYSQYAALVESDGTIHVAGDEVSYIHGHGLRPALWLNLD
jgi:hypothetical protein